MFTTKPRPSVASSCPWLREPDDDAALVRAAVAGDPLAVERLFRICWAEAHHTCLAILRCPHDTADVAQDTLLATVKRLPSLDPESLNLRGYVRVAARHHALNVLRRRSRHDATPLDESETLADTQAGTAERVEQQEIARQVRAAIRSLPDRQREALVRVSWLGEPVATVGDELGLNVNATAQLLHRARKGVAQHMLLAA